MYTQCPECSAVLEITAADLAVAGGFARCGQCRKSFDALQSLSDQNPATETVQAQIGTEADGQSATDLLAADTPDVTAASEIEPFTADSADDDGILLEPTETDAVLADPPDVTATAETRPSTTDSADDAAMLPEHADSDPASAPDLMHGDAVATDDSERGDEDEILLDESYQPPEVDDDEEFLDDDWDIENQAFADTEAAGVAGAGLFSGFDIDADAGDETGADTAAELSAPDNAGSEAETDLLGEDDSSDVDAVDESALFELPLPELTLLERPLQGNLPEKMEGGAAAHDPFAQGGEHPVATTDSKGLIPAAATGTRAHDAYDAEDARDLRDYLKAPGSRTAAIRWGGAAALMALLLIGQVIHHNRGDLVIHPRLGPVVTSLYEKIGVELRPNWHINEYKVVGQARLLQMPTDETDSDQGAALRFIAIISNGAELRQPPPMVRLTLRDRWGDATGIRNFAPPEYLADRAMIDELLEPGQRLRVVLNLYDPGAEVVGFDFDMCLPDREGTLRCANEG